MQRTFVHTPSSSGQFALRFRLLMSYHDLTLRDIAAATRSAVSTVGTWKNGRVPSSAQAQERLAEIFHVSVEYLLEGRPMTGKACGEEGLVPKALTGGILENLAALVQALEAQREPVELGSEAAELGAAEPTGNGHGPTGKAKAGVVRRREVENYVRKFLDRAERAPGGLAHAWVQLRREFPLDLYERLR